MSKSKIFLVILMALVTFALVYIPHLNYPMPLHIDEWHHISEGLRMGNYGEYFEMLKLESSLRPTGLEMGFQFILFLLSGVIDLVTVYKFLPALWAAISGMVLFYVAYKRTDRNFWLAILAMLFFASIRSNVNLTGIWFFTPLTFSIPFIFLYIHFFIDGIQKQKIQPLLISLAIMAFLIPIHSVSVLFAIPILLIYSVINFEFVIKRFYFFLPFLLIPVIGILFYKFVFQIDWSDISIHLTNALQFKYGWGILEVNNALTEVYPLVGYILAVLGIVFIILNKELKKYTFFLLWPLVCLIWIIIYRLTGVSYLSPYQRNLYYFALSLPTFSAFGFYYLIKNVSRYLDIILNNKKSEQKSFVNISFDLKPWQAKTAIVAVAAIIIIAVSFSLFNNYYKLPKDFALYHVIDQNDYKMLLFLSTVPKGNVMATPLMSAAVYPISRQKPIANLAFYGNVADIEKFFLQTDCQQKDEMIKSYNLKYIISPAPLDCQFKMIYAQNNNIIYQVNGSKQ